MAYDVKYSSNESLDRILRLLKGETVSETADSLEPPLNSWDESLSQIAELLNGTLEGYQARTPSGMSTYGALYTSIVVGAGQTLASGTFTKVNQFQSIADSYKNTTPSHSSDQITLNQGGTFLVGYNMDFAGTTGTIYDAVIYSDSTAQNETYSHAIPWATGTYQHLGASSIIGADPGDVISVYVRASIEGANFSIRGGQLWVKSV